MLKDKLDVVKGIAKKPETLVIAILILAGGVRFLNQSLLGYGDNLFFSLIILQLVLFVVPAIFYIKLGDNKILKSANIRLIRPSGIWITIVGILVVITGSCVIRMIMGFFGYSGSLMGNYYSLASESIGTLTGVVYTISSMVVIPAICEEFVFRGVIFPSKKADGAIFAIIVSSLLWALIKFNPAALAIYLFEGMVMCFIIMVTKSILSSVIIHIAMNYAVLMFEKYLIKVINQNDYRVLLVFILISLFLLSIVLLFAEGERYFHNASIQYITKREYREIKKAERLAKKSSESEETQEKVTLFQIIKEEAKKVAKYLITWQFLICLAIYILVCIFGKK